MKHTPGPWRTDGYRIMEDQFDRAKRGDDRQLATVGADWAEAMRPEAQANAELMATAPDLLDSLSGLVNHIQRAGRFDLRRTEEKSLLAQALKALAKARGEKQ